MDSLSPVVEHLKLYIELARLNQPNYSLLTYVPCVWSILLAAQPGLSAARPCTLPDLNLSAALPCTLPDLNLSGTRPGALPDLNLLLLFAFLSMLIESAGCVLNDILDQDFDRKVKRTKNRPLASGKLYCVEAYILISVMTVLFLLLCLKLNSTCLMYVACVPLLVIAYPLMKRVTHWPGLMLGMARSWMVVISWTAVNGHCDWSVCLPLYTAGVFFALHYDTIYGHQDKKDDATAGVKSQALFMKDDTKLWLVRFSVGMVTCLLVTGLVTHLSWPYYITVLVVLIHLTWQIVSVNLDDVKSCHSTYISNVGLGFLLALGIFIQHAANYLV